MLVTIGNPAPPNSPGPAVTYTRPHRVRVQDAHPDHVARVLARLGEEAELDPFDHVTEVTPGAGGAQLGVWHARYFDSLVLGPEFVGHHAWLSVIDFWRRGETRIGPTGAILTQPQGTRPPTWVAAFPEYADEHADDAATLAGQLSEFFGCPVGVPTDVEDTHWTRWAGRTYAPGERPPVFHDPVIGAIAEAGAGAVMLKPTAGFDLFSGALFDDVAGGGLTGTATSVTATTLVDTSQNFSGQARHFVEMAGKIGVITGVSTTTNPNDTVTIDQWSTPGSSDAVAATPAAGTYVVLPGNAPARYMALSTGNPSANSTFTPSSSDTNLPNEWVVTGGGLIRQRMTLSRTAGSTTTAQQAIFTANSTDIGHQTPPINMTGIGTGPSVKSATGLILYDDALPGTMAFNVSGDKGTVTITTTES